MVLTYCFFIDLEATKERVENEWLVILGWTKWRGLDVEKAWSPHVKCEVQPAILRAPQQFISSGVILLQELLQCEKPQILTEGTTHSVQLTGLTLHSDFNACCLHSSAANLRVFFGSELQHSNSIRHTHTVFHLWVLVLMALSHNGSLFLALWTPR